MAEELNPVNKSVPEIVNAHIATLIANGILSTPKQRKKRRSWESILAYEYITKFYEQYPHWYRIGLGQIPGGENNALYSKLRRYADVVVRMPDHMMIIELKMIARPDVVGQLLNYKILFPQTPMFEKYKELPLVLKVVCALVDEDTAKFIESNGIELEVYKGERFDEWYAEKISRSSLGQGTKS